MLARLLHLAHRHAYVQARKRSSPLWWAVAIGALVLARHEEHGEEREVIRVKPGHHVRVGVSRPPQ